MHSVRFWVRATAATLLVLVSVFGIAVAPSQAATSTSVVEAPAVAGQVATDWSVYTTFYGKNGEDVPLRNGDLSFGLRHIQDRHPMDTTTLVGYIDSALEDGTYTTQSNGDVRVRNKTATGGTFRVVFTERVDSASGDGRSVGIITAFLE
ncbi:hypothetical protein [Streptomyces sp. 7N604]|uniref:hypothetical protein n=1 Tax=Streptomyces sp. 7N604 TaxID=3457415 RepID=UPI003FD566DD